MTTFLTAGSAGGERDRLVGALLAFAQAPSDQAETALRRVAPGREEELVALGEALHAFPGSEWHRVLRGGSRATVQPAGLPDAAGLPTGAVLQDALADPAVAAAFSAYLDRPERAERAALVGVAPATDGAWLVAFADALRCYPGSGWGSTAATARMGSAPAVAPRTPVASVTALPVGRPHRPARRHVAAAAAVVLLAGAVAGFVATQHRASPPVGTVPTVAAAWRLAGEIAQPAWEASTGARSVPTSATVACPDDIACYAADPVPGTAGEVVEASTDGGASWRTAPLPGGFQLSSSLACPTADVCLGAGHSTQATGARHAAVVETDDGGASWAVEPLPAGIDQILDLACPTATDCVGVGYATPPAGTTSSEGPSIAVATTDGGTTWTETALPQPFFPVTPDGVACTSSQDCVLVGTTTLDTAAPGAAVGTALVTADSGATWSRAEVPTDVGIIRAVSCAPGGRCLALANRAGPVPSSARPGDWPSVALTTTTGRSWVAATGTGLMIGGGAASLSCPTTGDCWALGWRAGTPAGHLVPEAQTTDDGGASWTTVPLPARLTASAQKSLGVRQLDVETATSVSCPTATVCVALGTAATTTSTLERQIVLRENSVDPTK